MAGGGSIIPFASGLPINVTSVLGGVAGIPAFVGFGSSAQGLTVLGTSIDITGAAGGLTNFAFQVPRSVVITSFSAFFSTTIAIGLPSSSIRIVAQIYASTTPNNIFTPLAGTLNNLNPPLTGVLAVGTILTGSLTGLSISVPAGTRLMLVFSAVATGTAVLQTFNGYASAGLAIS